MIWKDIYGSGAVSFLAEQVDVLLLSKNQAQTVQYQAFT